MRRGYYILAGSIVALCAAAVGLSPFVDTWPGVLLLVAVALTILLFARAMTDQPAMYPEDEWEAKKADAGHPSEANRIVGKSPLLVAPFVVSVDPAKGDELYAETMWRRNPDGSLEPVATSVIRPPTFRDDDDSNGKLSAALARFEGRSNER